MKTMAGWRLFGEFRGDVSDTGKTNCKKKNARIDRAFSVC
jgi:hypothetical protein